LPVSSSDRLFSLLADSAGSVIRRHGAPGGVRAHHDLSHNPHEEFEKLVEVYRRQGLSERHARAVVKELTAHNPLGAHPRAEYGVHRNELTTP
jgi:hypothetical protein